MATDIGHTLRQIDDFRWEMSPEARPGMRVPGLVYASKAMLQDILKDKALEQVANVATLPGIVQHSLAMPDLHWGYGFPVGGVAATRSPDGVISPGGVGFDINCGVRMLRTDLQEDEVRPRLKELVSALYTAVPSGVGSAGPIHLSGEEIDRVMVQGARWSVEHGYGDPEDLEVTEESGCIGGARPEAVHQRPRERGAGQLGTLGAGNHFLEVQVVDQVYDGEVAGVLGIEGPGQVVVMFHCGSRGFGHQVCTDYVRIVEMVMERYDIRVPDRQLACAPLDSPEGQDYLAAMRCAANYAWANRQAIAHSVREAFARLFGRSWQELGMRQVYDVAHNIAKLEEHLVDGRPTMVCVHRKGATRAFPAGHPELPERYRATGQPILIPGDMGRYSFLCIAGPRAMEESFGTTCHGAGRTQSRTAAKRMLRGRDIQAELAAQGIIVRARGWASLAEEASVAYKDVADVVEVCHQAGLASRVARLRPLGVVKG